MKVLAIGAHPDDVEIGCGASLLAHRKAGDEVTLLVMTKSASRSAGDRVAEQEDAARALGARLCWGGFTDGAVPSSTEAVNAVETAIRVSGADLVYTHCARDTHQDHRATSLASLAATRHVSRVLCYESPTTIGFSPSLYVNVAGLVEAKLDLVRCHISQVLKNGIVDLEAIEAQARFRGFNSRARFAEGFEVVRFLLDPMRAGPNGASAGTTETTETTGSIEESGWAVSRNASNMDLELEA